MRSSDATWHQTLPSAGHGLRTAVARSIERNTVDDLCVLAGAELQSDPEPQRSTRYQSVSWCSTDKFLIMQSWTNGARSPGRGGTGNCPTVLAPAHACRG